MKFLKFILPIAIILTMALVSCDSPADIGSNPDIETYGNNVRAYVTDFSIEQNGITRNFKLDSSDIRIDFNQRPPVIKKFKLYFKNTNTEVSKDERLVVDYLKIYFENQLLKNSNYHFTQELDNMVKYDLNMWTDPQAYSSDVKGTPKVDSDISFTYLKNEKKILATFNSRVTDRITGEETYYDPDNDRYITYGVDRTEVIVISMNLVFKY